MPVFINPETYAVTVKLNIWMGDALVVIMLSLVIGLASITYELIEEPGRHFGRKLVASGTKMLPR